MSTIPIHRNPSQQAETESMVFVGRQPIFDRQMNVMAYELLCRTLGPHVTAQTMPCQATAQVLLHSLFNIGLERIVGDKRAFINVSRGFLLLDYVQDLPPERVGIEIFEDARMDDEVLEAVRVLSRRGYTIALDNFCYTESRQPLVGLADIIKLDVQDLGLPKLAEHVAQLRHYPVALLAQKVETRDEYRYCHDLGFDYFQGYFLCRPDIVTGQRLPSNKLVLLHLLAQLNHPDVEIEELEILIQRDMALSYKLLRLINSAYFGMPRHIDSVRQALLLLGTRSVLTMVSLMLLSGIDDKPHELVLIALVRAKMCEQLAPDHPSTSFLVGLFSVLDALMDRPMAEVMAELPLADEVTQALVAHEGLLGQTLHLVIAYERGDQETLYSSDRALDEVMAAYIEALSWATEVDRTL